MAGSKSKKSQEWDQLAKELRSLIPKLDEEGLDFLVKQAHVHLYNMQVEVLNYTIIESRKRTTLKVSAKTTTKKASSSSAPDGFSIKISDTGSSHHIIYKNDWIIFSKAEMSKLVKIAKGEGSDLEIRERLFNWFKRERSDLLYTARIADKFDEKMKSLAGLLKKIKIK